MIRIIFYFITLVFLLWFGVFLKPDLLPFKKYDCYDVKIWYFGDKKLDDFCFAVEELFFRASIDNKIRLILLPTLMYRFLTLNASQDFYLNLLNRSLFVNEDRMDRFDRSLLLEKMISLKILYERPLLSYLSIPKWKIIGYSRYLINEVDSFVLKDICYDDKRGEPGYDAFENKVVVKYLFERKEYKEDDFFNDNISYSSSLDEIKKYSCK